MKCPKCGYNSFEYLDSCRKCNADLVGYKASLGITPTILPAKELIAAGISEAPSQESAPAPIPASAPIQDTEEFSWQEPSEDAPPTAGALPSLGLDLPPPEPDHFNFNLDLPASDGEITSEAQPEEFPFEGFGDDNNQEFLLGNEAADADQPTADEPAVREETPFGELSFDDIYSGEEKEDGAAPAAPEETPLPDFFAAAEEPTDASSGSADAFEGLFELERTAVEEAPAFPGDDAGSMTTDHFAPDESAPDAATEDDLMGLSAEEYESLFGEPPKKKEAAEPLKN